MTTKSDRMISKLKKPLAMSQGIDKERELLVSFMQNDLSDPVRYEALQLAQRKLVNSLEQLERVKEAYSALMCFVELSPGDPDVTHEQREAYRKWEELHGNREP